MIDASASDLRGSDNGHYGAHGLALLNEARTCCVVEKGAIAKTGDFCMVSAEKMLCLSKVYLFVQYWGGEKGQKPAPLLEDIIPYETF